MKYIGAGLIFICSVLFGYFLSQRTKQALAVSEQIYRVMLFVRDEICVNRTPTNIILSRIPGCDASEGLYKSFENRLSALQEDERRIFFEFCQSIGKSGAEVQRGTFDALLSQYGSILVKRREKAGGTAKLYLSLSAFFGLMAVIIFL